MDDEDILFAMKRKIRRKKEWEAWKRRKMCVREIYIQRNESGMYHNLVLEMALGDRELYFKYPINYYHVYVQIVFSTGMDYIYPYFKDIRVCLLNHSNTC